MEINCPKCGQGYVVDPPEEELRAECGVCGAKFTVYPPAGKILSCEGCKLWLQKRRNLPNRCRDYSELAAIVPAAVRARSFAVPGVDDPAVLAQFREVCDRYCRGQLNLADARAELKIIQGKKIDSGDPADQDPGNPASSAQLELILDYEAATAAAVGRWIEGLDPDILERWPYWRYGGADACPVPGHQEFDGRVYAKRDPVWRQIFPPGAPGCRCWIEEADAEEIETAGTTGDTPPIPESGEPVDWEAAAALVRCCCVSDEQPEAYSPPPITL